MSRLKGFQDLMPAVMEVRWRIIEVVVQMGKRSGFKLMDTPTLEYYRTLVGDNDLGETIKQVYRFTDGGGRDVGLRFDLTVPFARFVAEHQHELIFPFKRIQFGDVFRGEKPQMERGRFRQFCQCDFDIVGVDGGSADAEVVALAYTSLQALGAGEFTIALNDRQITLALVRRLMPKLDAVAMDKVLIAIDKLAKVGRERVLASIVTITNAQVAAVEELLALLTLGDQLPLSEYSQAGVQERWQRLVSTRAEILAMSGGQPHEVVIDLAIVRGLGYYTGIVFETELRAAAELGSVCSGGRYADLVSRFANKPCAGVGGSIGVDRLAMHLAAQSASPPTTLMLAVVATTAREYAYQVARDLRSNGIAIDVDVSGKGLKQQLRYAHRQGYRKVLIVGSKEADTATVTVRDMETGTEQVLDLQELGGILALLHK
ncbi:MAG: histidine--tRNA ligase [Pseudomonadota bacterium]|nr:histidine--tRNA ligase [Pseudomonadota bacterium]